MPHQTTSGIGQRIRLFIGIGSVVNAWACTDSEPPELIGFFCSKEIPVVTGIHVTTETMPDGTGEVIGTRAYDVSPGSVNAFPNPLIEPDTITRFVYYPTHIIFNRLLPLAGILRAPPFPLAERKGTDHAYENRYSRSLCTCD